MYCCNKFYKKNSYNSLCQVYYKINLYNKPDEVGLDYCLLIPRFVSSRIRGGMDKGDNEQLKFHEMKRKSEIYI